MCVNLMCREIQFTIDEESLTQIFQRPISEIDDRLILQLVTNALSLFFERKLGLGEQDVLIGYTGNFSINTN